MKGILTFALLSLVGVANAQGAETSFVLDASKPYVYLAFDHLGLRKPIQEGESSEGLWLRVVNNCKVPIRIKTFRGDADNLGVLVFDEIVPVAQGFTVYSSDSEIPLVASSSQSLIGEDKTIDAFPAKPEPRHGSDVVERASEPRPRGYSSDLAFVSIVLPGKSLLFSVPRNHVSPSWFMRVKFTLDVSKPSVGMGPQTELDFYNEQIPAPPSSR